MRDRKREEKRQRQKRETLRRKIEFWFYVIFGWTWTYISILPYKTDSVYPFPAHIYSLEQKCINMRFSDDKTAVNWMKYTHINIIICRRRHRHQTDVKKWGRQTRERTVAVKTKMCTWNTHKAYIHISQKRVTTESLWLTHESLVSNQSRNGKQCAQGRHMTKAMKRNTHNALSHFVENTWTCKSTGRYRNNIIEITVIATASAVRSLDVSLGSFWRNKNLKNEQNTVKYSRKIVSCSFWNRDEQKSVVSSSTSKTFICQVYVRIVIS